MTIIKALNIYKRYWQNLVIENASFNIEEGRFYTVLGLNGSGKSTLLNVLSGRVTKDKSEAEIFGVPLGEDLKEKRSQIAYVSENMSIGLGLNVKTFIETYATQFDDWDQEYFEYLNKHRKLDLSKKFNDYSRGQKMQLFLLVALAQKPKLLFVDEITSVLDYKARAFFLTEMAKITKSGGTVVLTTNIITEVHKETTDLIIIKDKRLLYQGKKSELFKSFIKLKDQDTKPVPHHPALFSLGLDGLEQNNYLIEPRYLSESMKAFIDHSGPNLGEVFIFLTEGEFANE